MKRFISTSLLLAATVSFSGCADSHAEAPGAPEAPAAARYKAGHGVQLSAAAQAFVGITTLEIGAAHERTAGDGYTLPAVALLRTARGDFVYVANGDAYLRTPVTVHAVAGDEMVIRDGLFEGDVLVLHGVRALALAEIQALNGGVGCADGH